MGLPRTLVLALLLVLAGMFAPTDEAAAQAQPPAAAPAIYERMQAWNQAINARVALAVQNPRYFRAANVFWIVFSLIALVQVFLRAGFTGWMRHLPDLIDKLVLIALVWGLMLTYNTWTSLVNDVFLGLREILQTAITGDPDPFAPAFRILYAAESVNYDTGFALLDWAASIPIILASVLVTAVLFIICVVAAGASMWAFWGYTIMKLIGLFFVPFLLFDRLAQWFDNWFSLFAAFSIYNLLVSLSLNLAAYAFYLGLGYADPMVEPNSAPIVLTSIWQVFPIFFFACVSIWGIAQCSKLAQSLMGTSAVSAQITGLTSTVKAAFA